MIESSILHGIDMKANIDPEHVSCNVMNVNAVAVLVCLTYSV